MGIILSEEEQREQLYKELSKLMDTETGRKRRSDKGKSRSTYRPRSHLTIQSKVSIYNRVKARVKNRYTKLVQENDSHSIILENQFDANGFYIPIPETKQSSGKEYKQIYEGREIVHTSRTIVTQKFIDLEKYRFEAWQELAISKPYNQVRQTTDLNGILLIRFGLSPKDIAVALSVRRYTYLQQFCEIYFVKPEQVELWTYEKWLKYYKECPQEPLPDGFEFTYGLEPGTALFHPEWAYITHKQERLEQEAQQAEKQRRYAQSVNNLKRSK